MPLTLARPAVLVSATRFLTLSTLVLCPVASWGQSTGAVAPPANSTDATDKGIVPKEAAPLKIIERVPESLRRKIYYNYASYRVTADGMAEMLTAKKAKPGRDTTAVTANMLFEMHLALYLPRLARRYQVSASEIADIAQEGAAKNWPKPTFTKQNLPATPNPPSPPMP